MDLVDDIKKTPKDASNDKISFSELPQLAFG